MLIKRFGENLYDPAIQWYELQNGDKIMCDEYTIHTLWCRWVTGLNSIRGDNDKEVIFEFINPEEIDLTNKQ